MEEMGFWAWADKKINSSSPISSVFLVITFLIKCKINTICVFDAFVVKDDIEIGSGNIIPLWLFGFLY
jgi:hypothetical protein